MTSPAVRRFHIRTYGCQMNEHDSERVAGLLVAEGLEPTDRVDDADVVVLNTCCIRENADNKLYGHLGRLKALKDAKPDLQIAVGGCLAQKDRDLIVERAGHVDVVFGTHNLGRAPALLDAARRDGRPVVEIAEEHDPSTGGAWAGGETGAIPARRESRHSAWVTIQIGCDNSCTFCIVPSVRGPEVSRRLGDIVREVEALAGDGVREITLLGQNVNSYGRDLGAGQYRPQFADLLRALDAVPGIDRIRFTSPHPKDLRPETIAAMAECPAVCEHLHLPLQSGSDTVLARMHRGYTAERYLERLGAARAAIPDLAVTTDLIVGFPGETDAEFDETLAVVEAAGYDAAYTFVFSPRSGTVAAGMQESFVADDIVRERMERLKDLVDRHALDHHEARIGRVEDVLVDGPSKKDPAVLAGRTRQNKLVHFAADVAPGSRHPVRITGAAPHWLRGETGPRAHPRAGGLSLHLALVGPTASGKSELALAVARELGDVEIVSLDSMQVYRGMDVGTAKPSPVELAAVPHHLVDVVEPSEEWSVVRTQAAARAAVADIEDRGRRALLVGGTGLYVQAVIDTLEFPGEDLASRAELESWTAEPGGVAAAYAELAAADPEAAARIDPHNVRRIVRALEVIRLTGRRFSSFGPGVDAFGETVFPVRVAGVWLPAGTLAARIEARVEAMRRSRARRRGGPPRRGPCGPVAHRRAGDRLPRAARGAGRPGRARRRAAPPGTGGSRGGAGGPGPHRPPDAGLRPSPADVVPPGSAHHLVRHHGESGHPAPRAPVRLVGAMTRLSKLHATGNDFLVTTDPVTPRIAVALCDRHRGVGADGLIALGPGGGGADCTMTLFNADGGLAEMSGNGIRCLAWVAHHRRPRRREAARRRHRRAADARSTWSSTPTR